MSDCDTTMPSRQPCWQRSLSLVLWYTVLVEGIPIMLTLICLYGLITDPIKDAS